MSQAHNLTMQEQTIPIPDRILVCLSSHSLGERLIRAGSRLAHELNAEWFVLFVETPGHLRMPPENRERIQRNLALTEELGGKVSRVFGQSVADELFHFCRQNSITKIIVGKPIRSRWYEVFHPSVANEIFRKSEQVDVYVVSDNDNSLIKFPPHSWMVNLPFGRFIASLFLVFIATWISISIHPYLEPTNLVMIYLAVVVVSAVFLGRGHSILTSFLSVLAFDFFIVNPQLSFAVSDTQYLITFFGLLVVGLIISNSTSLLRDQVTALRKREEQTQALNRFGKELTGAITLDQVLDVVVNNIGSHFNHDVIALLPEGGHLVQKAATPFFFLTGTDIITAEWVFMNRLPANTNLTLQSSMEIRFSPLITIKGVIGVLGIKPNNIHGHLTTDQQLLLDSFNNLSALAIERAKFAEDSLQAEKLRSAERLHTALLDSISHQLRTPLATITGVLTTLSESEKMLLLEKKLDESTKISLLDMATDQARQLNRFVENLLDMTRLEAGSIHVHCDLSDLQELISAVIKQLASQLQHHPLNIHIPVDLPNVNIDVVLIAQVLINLLENACKYSPPQSPITIRTQVSQDEVIVSVQDEGIGIPVDDLERVFEKFYRVNHPHQMIGCGLGLSICKGIIEAHGGRIWANHLADIGTLVSFSLPLAKTET